jgi:hypothetical protein
MHRLFLLDFFNLLPLMIKIGRSRMLMMSKRRFLKQVLFKSFAGLKLKLFVFELKRREVETKRTKGRVYEIMSV